MPSKVGWKKVRDKTRPKLLCNKLNTGKHDNPRYDAKYATVEKCQDACLKLVKNCDAVNYDPDKHGKCGFEQCNGEIKFGGTKGFDSYIYVKPLPTTSASNTGVTGKKTSETATTQKTSETATTRKPSETTTTQKTSETATTKKPSEATTTQKTSETTTTQ